MTRPHRVIRPVGAALLAGALLFGACDDDSERAGSAPGVAFPDAPLPAAGGGSDTLADSVTVVARRNQFSVDALDVRAGSVTLQLENRDTDGLHNVAIYEADDGPDPIASTPIISGPGASSVTFEASPGAYYFSCQVHPEMHGELNARTVGT